MVLGNLDRMRAYRLHDTSWTRIVTHRVRRPNVIAARMGSRRRRSSPIPADGQLVLLDANHRVDPRTGEVVDRRELLDRLVEALSVPEVDGVVGSANLLEELTILNALEDRLAVCHGASQRSGLDVDGLVAGNFDAVAVTSGDRTMLAASVAAAAACGIPSLVDLEREGNGDGSDFDSEVADWIAPLESATAAVATGAGVWFTLPPIVGMSSLAAQTGFPVLVRDTDVPISPTVWAALMSQDLPLNVRGLVTGASALFPIEGSVGSATEQIGAAVRGRSD